MSMTDVVRFEYRSARVKLVEEGINEGPEKVSYMVRFRQRYLFPTETLYTVSDK